MILVQIGERDRDRESVLSNDDGPTSNGLSLSISSNLPETSATQQSIDILFDKTRGKSAWEPLKSPETLGELLDSRYMLPLLFPSDPRMLAASPSKLPLSTHERKKSGLPLNVENGEASTPAASAGSRGALNWRFKGRRVRDVGVGTLRWVDGLNYTSRWSRAPGSDEDDKDNVASEKSDEPLVNGEGPILPRSMAPLTHKPSARNRATRNSMSGETELMLED
jgi:hypothetical protein